MSSMKNISTKICT